MQPVTPLWITVPVVATTLSIPVVAWLAFQRVARRSARELVAPTFVAVALWLVLAFTLSARGFFAGSANSSVPPVAWALLPLAAGYLGYLTITSARAVVDQIPLHRMIGLQFYRALGVVFLVEWMLGVVPGAFALPAGVGMSPSG